MTDDERPTLTIAGRWRSLRFAARGVVTTLKSQHNAWLHAASTLVVALAGFICHLNRIEWCLIVFAIIAVWVAEALNTAIEYLADVASPGFHPIAGKAKDVAAGGVLIAAIGSAIVGIMVFGPHLFRWLGATPR
jgi:diacylglycerol kinase (ATP)